MHTLACISIVYIALLITRYINIIHCFSKAPVPHGEFCDPEIKCDMNLACFNNECINGTYSIVTNKTPVNIFYNFD